MQPNKIYTRAYSTTTPREIVSRRGQLLRFSQTPHEYPPHFPDALRYEFINHSQSGLKIPTALVSTSTRLIDTVTRAYKLWEAGNNPENIWIAFIKTPHDLTADSTPRIHHGEALATQYGPDSRGLFPSPKLFRYEYVVEWAIPPRWIVHTVSLQTLINRGLDWKRHFETIHASNGTPEYQQQWTQAIRFLESRRYQGCSPWEIGVGIGCFMKYFGARAPLWWIRTQIFQDLFLPTIDTNYRILNLRFGKVVRGYEVDDIGQEMNDGIDLIVIDGWLTSSEFLADNAAYEAEDENLMWQLMDWEGSLKKINEVMHDMEKLKLEAVRIGL
jgi:hypothetical protein